MCSYQMWSQRNGSQEQGPCFRLMSFEIHLQVWGYASYVAPVFTMPAA